MVLILVVLFVRLKKVSLYVKVLIRILLFIEIIIIYRRKIFI